MFKKVTFWVFTIFVMHTNCGLLRKAGLVPSELDMITGLRQALEQGMFKSFDEFANPQNNALLKMAMPGEMDKLQTVLSTLGVKTNLSNISSKMSYAMTQSIAVSKPVFLQTLRQMNLRDASKILITDNTHAATDYFKANATASLIAQLTPVVDSTVKLDGFATEYAEIAQLYNSIPFIGKKIEPSVSSFIAGRTVDIMFSIIAKEEQEIRSKYALRKTDLMKRVFTYAEQEIKKKYANVMPQ